MSARSAKENPEYLSQCPQEIEEHFAGIVKCSNSECGESVAVCGFLGYDQHWAEHDYGVEDLKSYQPKFFFPALNIFKIDSHCPSDIRQQLIKSFSHFFNDPWAAANAARSALELMMDNQGIKKQFKTRAGKMKKHDLHARIDLFGNNNPDLKSFLMAAKWIGNAGSHPNEITKDDVLDGYSLMDHAIYELYVKDKKLSLLKRTAAGINKSRKPGSTKKRNK